MAFATAPGRGPLVVSGSADESVRVWDPGTGTPAAQPLTGFTGGVDTVAFGTAAGDGETGGGRLLLAVSSGGNTVRVWDPFTGAPVTKPLAGHTVRVRSLAFGRASGGRLLLASGGDDRTVQVWEPLTGALAGQALTGHTGWVDSVAFGVAPSGRLLLASGGGDKTVRVWDVATRHCLATVHRRSTVRSLAMAGTVLAIGDDDGLSVIEPDVAATQTACPVPTAAVTAPGSAKSAAVTVRADPASDQLRPPINW